MCRNCIHAEFWKATTINVFAGWWGIISFFYTFAFLCMNLINYLGCLKLPGEYPKG